MFKKIDKSKFEKDGFLVIKNILSKNEIKKAEVNIDKFLEKNLKKKITRFILLIKKLTQYII